jgi:hypothetical protein
MYQWRGARTQARRRAAGTWGGVAGGTLTSGVVACLVIVWNSFEREEARDVGEM